MRARNAKLADYVEGYEITRRAVFLNRLSTLRAPMTTIAVRSKAGHAQRVPAGNALWIEKDIKADWTLEVSRHLEGVNKGECAEFI